MPHIVIDGQRFEAPSGKTVIEVAYENGLTIPHFCWHPELSISGNCRMCLVEIGSPKKLPDGSIETDAEGKPIINYFPKLQIACATYITDGMYVRTKSENVIRTQEAIMEFLLINHPLDCPICDEAGQCKLQEYAFNHSSGKSRFIEQKNHKPKRISWGPNVLFDAERCISCSRCIRFAKEIAKQDVLTFVNRGDHVTIELAENTEFDNPYSMNVIDICPVGALTSKDFRFKARVWDMSFNDSICPGCARGCNIKIGVRNNEILRIEPAPNPYVNKYWMCDYGRLTQHHKVNINRLINPIINLNSTPTNSNWQEAITKTVDLIKKYKPNEIMVIASPFATNEDNYLLQKFTRKILKTENIDFFEYINEDFADDFLKVSDQSPNIYGLKEIGIVKSQTIVNASNLAEKIKNKSIKVLFSIDDNIGKFSQIFNVLDNLQLFILCTSNKTKLAEKAHILLPSSTFAEVEGTYVNINKRVQHFEPAITTKENRRYMGMKMSRLDKFGAHNDRWTQHEIRDCLPIWKIITLLANQFQAGWNYKRAQDVFTEIATHISSFKGMNYNLLDEYYGLPLNFNNVFPKKTYIYQSHYMKPE